MARKFLSEGPFLDPNRLFYISRKKRYFFYGTLMDPTMLVQTLDLRDQLVLLPD